MRSMNRGGRDGKKKKAPKAKPEALGCARCFQQEAETVWAAAIRFKLVKSLVDSSHFGVSILACQSCGARCVQVFTELMSFSGGGDSQSWSLIPMTLEESELLCGMGPSFEVKHLLRMTKDRRFLLYVHTGGKSGVHWNDRGFSILPHH